MIPWLVSEYKETTHAHSERRRKSGEVATDFVGKLFSTNPIPRDGDQRSVSKCDKQGRIRTGTTHTEDSEDSCRRAYAKAEAAGELRTALSFFRALYTSWQQCFQTSVFSMIMIVFYTNS